MEDSEIIAFDHENAETTPGYVESDNCGAFYHKVFPVFVPSDWTLERATAAIKERVTPDRCYHSYDCCGNFYGRSPVVLGEAYLDNETKVVWVQRTYVQNV